MKTIDSGSSAFDGDLSRLVERFDRVSGIPNAPKSYAEEMTKAELAQAKEAVRPYLKGTAPGIAAARLKVNRADTHEKLREALRSVPD